MRKLLAKLLALAWTICVLVFTPVLLMAAALDKRGANAVLEKITNILE